jgi:nucleoside-diphosphate-sugar epimerase
MAKLVFGCGYLGHRVAERWQQHTDVYVVTRSPERARRLSDRGFRPLVGDITESWVCPNLPPLETILFSVGFDRDSGKRIQDVYVGGLRRVLDQLPDQVGQFLYVSSTGVFGQSAGESVNEQSPCQPTREGGRACLEAEQLLAAHPLGPRATILRLAGIYGPGRIPKLDEIRAGLPIGADADAWLNLIHVEDAVEVILKAEERAQFPNMYVVSDGNPVLRRNFYEYLARLVGAPRPAFEIPATTTNTRGGGDKRVNPAKMMRDLRPTLKYPTFREGLDQIVAAAGTPSTS